MNRSIVRSDNRKYQIFFNASLSSLAERQFNERLKQILEEQGFKCVLPQDSLPPGPNIDATDVFKSNQRLIKSSDIVLSVLDKPGEGVIFELGAAFTLGKPIVIFRSDEQDYLGKIVEGIYKLIPDERKTGNPNELGHIIKKCLKIL